MAILPAGGGLSDILLAPGLGGTIAIAALEDITLWSAESGGTQWTVVQSATAGQEWPAGVGRTNELGRIGSVVIDVGLADPATAEVWAQRQAQPGRRYRLSTGPATTGSVLTDLAIPGALTLGETPNDVVIRAKGDGTSLEQSTDGGASWSPLTGGGGGGGSVLVARYTEGSWPARPDGGTGITVFWLSATPGVPLPPGAIAGHDPVWIATA